MGIFDPYEAAAVCHKATGEELSPTSLSLPQIQSDLHNPTYVFSILFLSYHFGILDDSCSFASAA
jgi:hypothetical protein